MFNPIRQKIEAYIVGLFNFSFKIIREKNAANNGPVAIQNKINATDELTIPSVKNTEPDAWIKTIKVPVLLNIKKKFSLYSLTLSVIKIKMAPIWKPLQNSIVQTSISESLMNNVSGVKSNAPKKAIKIPFALSDLNFI